MDSLSVLPFILDTGCLLDFGSGGGLPGIPIAIMKPDLRIDLLEATRMKCLFLKEMVKVLELNSVAVIHSRSENLVIQPKYKQRYGRITARAVAPLPSLWASTCELLSTDGKLIAFKGPEYESEKSVPVESGIELKVQEVKLPIIEGKRVFVMVNHVSRET
jgi:16S rRNA (guanine527-N7)-methyltransferase